MEFLKVIPYILVGISIFISTIISLFSQISFIVFIKRSILFYIAIFIASRILVGNIHIPKKISANKSLGFKENSSESHIGFDHFEEDAFIPLDFKEYVVSKKNKES